MQKRIFCLLMICMLCACFPSAAADGKAAVWDSVMTAALRDGGVGQVLQVRYQGGSEAEAVLYMRKNGQWQGMDSCTAFVGREGIGKTREGDGKTPTGELRAGRAFGILPNPGTAFPYLEVTDNWYGCDDDATYYNQLIDTSVVHHRCHGEHLIAVQPDYHYALTTSYNQACVYGKGSCIFVHCKGTKPSTSGCIALDEPMMKHLLQVCDSTLLISIHDAEQVVWNATDETNGEAAIRAMVDYVHTTYPLANLQDVYKTCYQDYFGSEHLSPDTATVRYWLQHELQEAQTDRSQMPKQEPTGWRHRYERVSLQCILDGEMSEEQLLDAFLAARQPLDSAEWQSEWRLIDSIAVRQVPEWRDETLRAYLMECARRCAPVRQSEAFRAAYHPHYRIACRRQ